MIIPFRQGIVKAPLADNNQLFILPSMTGYQLSTTSGEVVCNICHRDVNYLHYESKSVFNAWNIQSNINCWLYIDINTRTGIRTFGTTIIEPTVSATAPQPIPNAMWFNTTERVMYVGVGTIWVECIRLVLVRIRSGEIQPYNGGASYLGSQISDNSDVDAGTILIGQNNVPLKKGREFLTTVDTIFTSLGNVVGCKLESLYFEAQAITPMAAFTVVELSDFGKIQPLGMDGIYDSAIGIIVNPINTGESCTVIPSGIIENPNWNWSTVSATLYSDEAGSLTETHIPGSCAVAFVVEPTKILFTPTMFSSRSNLSIVPPTTRVQGYSNASGSITVDATIRWHTIIQTGPITLNIDIPENTEQLVQFTIEVISNGSIITWASDNTTTQGDYVGSVDVYTLTYRPARGNVPSKIFKEMSHFN